MTQIMELMDKRAKAWEAAKAFLNSHSQNGGMVSAEDAATYDKMEKEVTDLTKDIERLQRQEQIDKMMSAPTSTPLTGKPGVKDEPEDKPGRASAAYKKAFWDNIRHPGNPAIRDVLEEGTDANGGYLVPIEFEHTLVQALNENNIMRTIGCKVITTQNERKIPVANGHTQAAWTAENGAYTESNPTFAQTSIDAFKLTDLIKVSDELLSDSFFDIEGYISEEFGRAFGEAEEDAFIKKLAKEPWFITTEELHHQLQKHQKSPIKATILDQTIICGLGNIYADETLFAIGIHPETKSGALSIKDCTKLISAAKDVMQRSIDSGGSTMATYVKADGTKGDYLEKFAQVFHRENQPCPKCGTKIIKIRVAGRGTHVCPHCQRRLDD